MTAHKNCKIYVSLCTPLSYTEYTVHCPGIWDVCTLSMYICVHCCHILSPLSRYMGCMYNLDAFTTSCPADQDIISHYKMQQVISHRIKKILKEWYITLKHSRLSFRVIYSLKNHYPHRKKKLKKIPLNLIFGYIHFFAGKIFLFLFLVKNNFKV